MAPETNFLYLCSSIYSLIIVFAQLFKFQDTSQTTIFDFPLNFKGSKPKIILEIFSLQNHQR